MAGAALLFDLVSRDRASAGFMSAARSADKTAASTARAERSLLGFSRSAVVSGAKLAGVFGAFEIAKKAIDIGKEAAAFQRDMTRVQTMAGASAAEVKSFSAALLTMAGQVAQAPEALATSLYHVYSVGLRGADALKAVRIAAEGARVGNADLEETTNALTSTIASGILGTKDYGKAMGALNAIVGAGDMSLTDLNDAMHGIFTVAKTFGVSLTQAGAALAVFGDHNIRGADAATALRMSIQDLAKPAAGADAVLSKVGLTSQRLRDDLQKGGLTSALSDLRTHMTAAGITAGKVGPFIVNAFTKKAGTGLAILINDFGRYQDKLEAVATGAKSFGDSWAATKKTTSFVFGSLNAELTSFGITVAQNVMPAVTQFAAQVGVLLPRAFKTAGDIVGPFAHNVGDVLGVAWTAAGTAFSIAGAALKPLVALISALKEPLGAVGTAVVGAWVAFKLFSGIPGLLETAALKVLYMKDAVVGMGTSAKATGARVVGSMTAIGASSTAAADEVVVAGATARVGWAGLLGPIAAVAVGVGLLISQFHKSGGASKEAKQSIKDVADAAKSYTDAVKSGSGTTLAGQIGENLIAKGLPGDIDALNKALGRTRYSGAQFASAIQSGHKPLADLRAGLQQIVTANSPAKIDAMAKAFRKLHEGISGRLSGTDDKQLRANTDAMTAKQKAAAASLRVLTTQYLGLSKAQKTEISNLKQLGVVAAPVEEVGAALGLTGDQVKKYAGVLQLAVTKNDDLVDASKANQAAIARVASAYASASQSGSAFLSAMETFSTSTGSSADRAALIGSTLVAANGDALSYAGAMNAAATANHGLVDSLRQAAKQVGKNGISVKDLVGRVVDLKTGTINYAKAGAAPLISGLQSIQSAAMAAASATYQHNRATEGGKRAADDAYKVYKSQTRGALMDEATRLGLTAGQAKKLADKYFGMPKKVKTLIEQEGANPVVTVLNQIGTQLSFLTGHPWKPKVDVDDKATPKLHDIFNDIDALHDKTVTITVGLNNNAGQLVHDAVNNIPGSAAGSASWTRDGKLPPGLSTVGERGWELVSTDARGRSQVFSHAQSVAMTGKPKRLPGFAAGTAANNAGMVSSALRSAFHFTRNQIAGFLGNFQVESRMNPKAYNSRENAHGIAQWEGSRWTALQRYAKHMGVQATSMAAQTGFLVKELRGSGIVSKVKKMKDPAKVAAYVDAHYERSAGTTRKPREDAARRFARNGVAAARGGTGGASAGASSSSSRRHGHPNVGRITTGTLDGREVWIFGGKKYASLRAAQNARAAAVTKAEKGGASRVQGALGAVGQAPSRPFDINQVGYKTVSRQLAHARVLLDNADLTPKARASLTRQYNRALALAHRERRELRLKIRTADLKAISKAVGGTADDIRSSFQQVITDLRNEGASAGQIARVRRRETATVAANNKYVAAKDYSSGIKSTLAGGFDPTHFGSVQDMIAGFQGQTTQNNSYAKELTKLRGEAKGNKSELALINSLAASGQTASLESLAQGSKADLGAAAKAYSGYNASLQTGADAATKTKYGKTADQLHSDVEKMVQHTDKIVADMVRTVTHLAHAVGTAHQHSSHMTDRQIDHALSQMTTLAHHGRH